MARMFTVTLNHRNKAGNRTKWTGDVEAVPGEDIFVTARRTFAKRAKKGMVNLPRLIPGRSVAA